MALSIGILLRENEKLKAASLTLVIVSYSFLAEPDPPMTVESTLTVIQNHRLSESDLATVRTTGRTAVKLTTNSSTSVSC
jgi:hypothetical protein